MSTPAAEAIRHAEHGAKMWRVAERTNKRPDKVTQPAECREDVRAQLLGMGGGARRKGCLEAKEALHATAPEREMRLSAV